MPYVNPNSWRKTEELANAPTLGNLHPDARRQAIARAAVAERKAMEHALTTERLAWLHSSAAVDADGYEWGVFRVKWEDGRAVDVQRTKTDGSDLPQIAAPKGQQ